MPSTEKHGGVERPRPLSLRVGQGFRDRDKREAGRRVVFVTELDSRYAYVRSEAPPHRRARILGSRLRSSAFEFVGEMGTDCSVWPKWFAETQPDRKEES